GGDNADVNLLRLAFGRGQFQRSVSGRSESLEVLRSLQLVVAKVGRGDRGQGLAAGTVVVPDDGETIGIAILQRPQKDVVGHAEDSAVGANAEGQSKDGREGKRGRFTERSDCDLKVSEDLFHIRPSVFDIEPLVSFPIPRD